MAQKIVFTSWNCLTIWSISIKRRVTQVGDARHNLGDFGNLSGQRKQNDAYINL
jgi:hypothetical protein